MDGSDAARSAFVFVSDWAREFGARVWFIQLTDESTKRHGEIVTDVARRGRRLANTFTVSGATRAARDWQLASAIAEAAETFGADLVILGFDRVRLGRRLSRRTVRDRLSHLTDVPVMTAPNKPSNERLVRAQSDQRLVRAQSDQRLVRAQSDQRLVRA